jgi:hypothetical protein
MIYTIAVCIVKTPDDGQKTCPKHVDFYSENKFEKLVQLVGFIIRIYYDARSSECQKPLHVSIRLAAHHQEDQLFKNSSWYIHTLC